MNAALIRKGLRFFDIWSDKFAVLGIIYARIAILTHFRWAKLNRKCASGVTFHAESSAVFRIQKFRRLLLVNMKPEVMHISVVIGPIDTGFAAG